MPQYTIPPIKTRPTVSFPATIAAGATWTSGVVSAAAIKSIVVGAQIDQAGTLSIARYADAAGLVGVGAALSQAMTANTQAWTGADDGLPFASFTISILNSGGVAANVSKTSVLGNS